MATFSSVTRQHVLQALAEHDERGGDAFCELYGFAPSSGSTLVHEGRRYDARAVLGVAHRYATGRLATAEEFASSTPVAVAILRKRGFEVTGPPSAARAATSPARAARSTRPAAPRSGGTRAPAREERVAAICPTCFTTLPATGVCDTCG